MTDLHTHYRPTVLDEVVGQDAAVASLKGFDGETLPHAFLFAGESGVGKTTIARIIATEFLGVSAKEILEIDAATHTGVDAMRGVTEMLQYKALGKSSRRFIILDEAHMLSKAAWNSLLKALEEPPSHVYFCLCTTELDKVPKTIQTRCHTYRLKPISDNDLMNLLQEVVEAEGFDLNEDLLEQIVESAQGSARQALVSLSMCFGAEDENEVAKLLSIGAETKDEIELFRLLISGRGITWQNCQKIISKMDSQSYEGTRIKLMNYFGAALAKEKKSDRAAYFLSVMDLFAQPFNRSTEKAEFLLRIGELTLGE